MAACDGVVNVPSSWAASETESASGRPPRCSVTSRSASRSCVPRWRRWTSASFEPGHVPQPEEERQRRLADVLIQPPGDLDVRLLEYVGVVDPAGQPAAEAEMHHPLEPIVVASEQRH